MATSVTVSLPSGYTADVDYRNTSGSSATTTVTGGTPRLISTFNGQVSIHINGSAILSISNTTGGLTPNNFFRSSLYDTNLVFTSSGSVNFVHAGTTGDQQNVILSGLGVLFFSQYKDSSGTMTAINNSFYEKSTTIYPALFADNINSALFYFGDITFTPRSPYDLECLFKLKIGTGAKPGTIAYAKKDSNNRVTFRFYNAAYSNVFDFEARTSAFVNSIAAANAITTFKYNNGSTTSDINGLRVQTDTNNYPILFTSDNPATTQKSIAVTGTTSSSREGSYYYRNGSTAINASTKPTEYKNFITSPSRMVTVTNTSISAPSYIRYIAITSTAITINYRLLGTASNQSIAATVKYYILNE